MATVFNIYNGFVNEEGKEITTMKKEAIAPEVAGARRYWFAVMAPAIKAAEEAVNDGLKMNDGYDEKASHLEDRCEKGTEAKIWPLFKEAFKEAKRRKAERERRAAAIAAANLARREAAAAEKRARQAALAARQLERRDSVSRIAVAIGWGVDAVVDAIKAVRNGIVNATTKAYKAALKNARRERLNAASMFTAIGDLITDAQAYVMHIIGLINEDAAADSVAY